MFQGSESKQLASDELSALMDGELDASAVARVCGQWRDDGETRANWHAYQLIGDVLRSDDLVSDGAQDAAFLAAFRQRLAQEPVVLAPAPLKAGPQKISLKRRRTWAASAAVAAGFAAVAGVLLVTQMDGLGDAQPEGGLALVPSNGSGMVAVSAGSAPNLASDPPAVVLDGQLIRDVRLDEYLAAHKKFGGSSVPGGPSGFLRNAAADGSTR